MSRISPRTGCLRRSIFSLVLLLWGPMSLVTLAFEGNAPAHLQCEGMQEPLGIDIAHPRLSWHLQDSRRGARQAAYEVRVASSLEGLAQERADVWDSGRVESDQSVNVPYGGPAVESRRRYYWQVRVWDAQGQASSYSQASWWEMGLLSPGDWKAKWITRYVVYRLARVRCLLLHRSYPGGRDRWRPAPGLPERPGKRRFRPRPA